MKEEIIEPTILYCDNTNVINISKNIVMHAKTKHIAIKYNYVGMCRIMVCQKVVM